MTAALVFVAVMFLSAPQAPPAERVPDSAVVNGVPQGIFVGRSLITGRAVCLLFLSGGRITRAIPDGGLESFDWARHRAAHSGDSGTWQMRGGQLVVTWGDGGVHQGPITVNPDGIEFYGKRYAKPVPVGVGAIAGRWESARGTAITGGQGINRLSELVIQSDGRYQWGSTTGGVVSGRAVASDRTMTGQLSIRSGTLILTSDAGTTSSHTFLPVAGQPVTAFSVDADMFTRVGPAPPPAASAPANSYQGLAFTTPQGWKGSVQQGHFVLVPATATPDAAVLVVINGAAALDGKSFDDWLRAMMAAELSGLKVVQAAPPTRGRSGAFETLSAGRTVQDQSGNVLLQIYHAISDGKHAGLAMVATTSEAALKARIAAVQGLFGSLSIAQPADPAVTKGAITVADLVGSWSHSSSAYTEYSAASGGGSSSVAYGQGYDFAANGTYTYRFTGMRDRIYIRESDSGTWGFQGGNLVIRSRERNSTKTYQIVQYQTAPDGSASMTLLDAAYPRTDSNINVWGERFVRKSPRQ